MPNHTNPAGNDATKAAGRPIAPRGPSAPTGPAKNPSHRKPRTPKAAPAAGRTVKGSSSELDTVAADHTLLQEMETRLDTIRSRRDELVESIVAAERRLVELRREAASASETFGEASRLMGAARGDAEAIGRLVAEANTAARAARQEARSAMAEAARTRQELDIGEARAGHPE
jgi:hypothetical protein